MIEITSTDTLRVLATDGTQVTVMDEPLAKGGNGTALSPSQTLLAALGGCTAMTVQMYAQRKDWPLESVKVTVSIDEPERGAADPPRTIRQAVELTGDLDDAQRERLHAISGRCPVHRIMEGPLAFEETLV